MKGSRAFSAAGVQPMGDRPLFRGGKVILKVRPLPDGSVVLFKPFMVTEARIMRLTGAPGWDRVHVDEVFGEGVTGVLRYIEDIVEYTIPISEFREHAFIRMDNEGNEQYHVHKQYYSSRGLRVVSPKRESMSEIPALPKKLTFGEWVPCTRCRASGLEPEKRKERCTKCQGQGYEKWSSSSATS